MRLQVLVTEFGSKAVRPTEVRVAQLANWLFGGALLASLAINAVLLRGQRAELAGLRHELRQVSGQVNSERPPPSLEGMGWSRQNQELASEIARQVRAGLAHAVSSGTSAGPAVVPVAALPAPRAELPPGASDVGDTQPTPEQQAAYDEAEVLIHEVLASGTLTERSAEEITALRRKNGNRPEFFKLREQLIIALNQQKLTIESDTPQFAIP